MSVALCDAHGMFLDALADALQGRGYEVAGTTTDASRLPALVDAYDAEICVVGLGSGEAESLEAATAVKTSRADVGVVLLLGGAGSWEAWAAFDAGRVDAMVDKRCDIGTLDKTIERVRTGESVVEGCSRPSRDSASSPLDYLTDRERDVLRLIVSGLSTQRMSAVLGVSANTVRTHVQHVLAKLGVDRRSKAIGVALELGLVESPGPR